MTDKTLIEIEKALKERYDLMFKQNEEYGLRNNWLPQNIVTVTYKDLEESDAEWNTLQAKKQGYLFGLKNQRLKDIEEEIEFLECVNYRNNKN